ncbi:uncharacterized protein ZBAI_00192 [Zygosaccharomyces bailii ISA1307]|nr:uncharacterized protein ZBAI_00192 [Zygosaccharomyces bailii ISA1307]
MSKLNESYPLVSNETAEALVSSTVNALKCLNSNGDNQLIFKVIDALGLFSHKVVAGNVKQDDLEGIDVFTTILKSDEIGNKLDVVAIFLAYFSIHKELHPLIINSIESWNTLLPHEKATEASDTGYTPGFYTVVSQLDQYEEVTPQLLQYLDLELGFVLTQVWVPQWLQLVRAPLETSARQLQELPLANMLLCEAKLDFYIATSTSLGPLVKGKQRQEVSPMSYFIHKICKRISIFPDWIPKELYRPAAKIASYHGSSASGLHFDLQVLMEITDHPDINFFEEPRLAILLHQATNNLRKVPFHKVHAALGTLGTVQSLPAIINIVQFLLCKFLITVGNVCDLIKKADYQLELHPKEKKWFKAAHNDTYHIPCWFESTLLPPLPPITKSFFVFENNELESEQEANNFSMISDLLYESLDMVILINTELLKQYQCMKIDPLTIDAADETFDIRHRVASQYLLLYFIPLITASMLSRQAAGSQVGLLNNKKRHIMGKIIFSNTVRLCKSVIFAHANIALYHFIKLCAKVSTEDLILQGICLDLLYHLFFGQDGAYIRQLCLESELSIQTLQSYINLWNDGTDCYTSFFEKILEMKQPSVPIKSLPMSKLHELLPGCDAICSTQGKNATPKSLSLTPKNDPQQKGSLSSRSSNIGSSPPLTYKYNPYSSSSFAPQRPLTFNTPLPSGTYVSSCSAGSPETGTFKNRIGDGTTANAANGSNYNVFDNSLASESFSNLSRTIENLTGPPRTPSTSIFSSPWDGSPSMNAIPNNGKIVNTGKNYILGGHHRIKNNSRAQSIHIDNFKSDL